MHSIQPRAAPPIVGVFFASPLRRRRNITNNNPYGADFVKRVPPEAVVGFALAPATTPRRTRTCTSGPGPAGDPGSNGIGGATRPRHGGREHRHAAAPDFGRVAARRPLAFVWGGDIVYGDFPKALAWLPRPWSWLLPEVPIKAAPFEPASYEKLAAMYGRLKRNPSYRSLVQSLGGQTRDEAAASTSGAGGGLHEGSAVFGTWDDHDYGLNDAGRVEQPRGVEPSRLLPTRCRRMRRTGRTAHSSRRHLRAYSSSKTAPTTTSEEEREEERERKAKEGRRVLVVVLDMRWNKDPYVKPSRANGFRAAASSPEDDLYDDENSAEVARGEGRPRDFLGEEQWAWLDDLLRRSSGENTTPAVDAHVFVSSLQLLPAARVHAAACRAARPCRGWARFPAARRRFLRLLRARAWPRRSSWGDVTHAEILASGSDCGGHGSSNEGGGGGGGGGGGRRSAAAAKERARRDYVRNDEGGEKKATTAGCW